MLSIKELNRCVELKERLERCNQILGSLQAAAYSGAFNYLKCNSIPKDNSGNFSDEISVIRDELEKLSKEIEDAEKLIAPFIESIPDTQLRMVFRLRFLRGMIWQEVADTIGGSNSVEGIKAACYRFLRKSGASRTA